MKRKTFIFNGRRCQVLADTYLSNGTLALILKYGSGERRVVSTNLCSCYQTKTQAFLDTNNNPGIDKFIEENGIGKPMYVSQRSGFCQYPLYIIFRDSL